MFLLSVTSSAGLPVIPPLSVDLGVELVEPSVPPIVVYEASDIAPGVVAPVLVRVTRPDFGPYPALRAKVFSLQVLVA